MTIKTFRWSTLTPAPFKRKDGGSGGLRTMQRRQEPCKFFLRGSCQYGERCKFLHPTQQQPKPNPFGFGVQNNSQQKGSSDFGAKHQNQAKPFVNKWNRFSPLNAATSAPSQQTEAQPQVVNHVCTDPQLCKQLIVEDFKHERPLWKLTCYGHWKYLPCDIVGDISYEELRTAAYEDARQGIPLQSIFERERASLNSKLAEFDSLLCNPYVASSNPSYSGVSLFPGTSLNASPTGNKDNVPPSVSSFSQLGSSLNLGTTTRPLAASNSGFGQQGPFQVSSQTSARFDMNNSAFGGFSMNTQQTHQPFGNVASSNIPNFSNNSVPANSNSWNLNRSTMSNFGNGAVTTGSNLFSSSQITSSPNQVPSYANNNQFSSGFNQPASFAVKTIEPVSLDVISIDTNQKGKVSGDRSIWLKEWKSGEIPEEEPPPDAC